MADPEVPITPLRTIDIVGSNMGRQATLKLMQQASHAFCRAAYPELCSFKSS